MSLYEVESLKLEKDQAMVLRYLHFKNIGNVFRFLEFLFAILFFSWLILRSSPYFSAAFHLLAASLHRFSILVVNHHFVFLLGNGIIVTLFVKFGQFACDNSQQSSADGEDFQIGEFVPPPFDISIIPAETETEVAPVEQRKEILVVKRESEVKRHRRSKSSVCDRKKAEKVQIRLRRSETEPRRSSVTEEAPIRMEFDDLSNEEFKEKIESVIEQHRRSLREESLFMVSAA